MGAANANQVYNHQLGRGGVRGGQREREKGEGRGETSTSPFTCTHHTRTRKHTYARTQREGGGERPALRGQGTCLQTLLPELTGRSGTREARPDPSAMMVAAVRSPCSGGGAANDAIPRPAPGPRSLLPAFFSTFLLEARQSFAPKTWIRVLWVGFFCVCFFFNLLRFSIFWFLPLL